jgi:alanyl-tRNA synthetase
MNTYSIQYVSSREIVDHYLSFFRERGHYEVSGSPLALPGNSTSFVIAGMQPLLPYLRGQITPPSLRLTCLQRCLRTDDIDAVGTNGGKNTSFHMLGNWSVGDYGRREAITMAFEFLLEHLGLDLSMLWVTVFAGDSELCMLPDEAAIEEWVRVGMPRERIIPLGVEDNLWEMGSGIGLCGPCSEIFVDRGPEFGCGASTCRPCCSCDRYLEIWNLVFMEFERLANGALVSLPRRNVDTGMGLERVASVLQGAESSFSIDLFLPASERLTELQGKRAQAMERRARRIILDHLRAVLLAGFAGVEPGRDGRGSVVRRLIRRAARQGRLLGIQGSFLGELVEPLATGHGSLFTVEEHALIPTLKQSIMHEETLFERVLTTGLRYLEQIEPDEQNAISGEQLFRLHAEKGFPADLAAEILSERGITVDWSRYERSKEEHRRVSRVSAEKHFRGM